MPEDIVTQMMSDDREKRLAKMVFTVLTRGKGSDGTWSPDEEYLITELAHETASLPRLPQHLILYGEYTKAQVLAAIGGGCTFTVEVIKGWRNEKLPFQPPLDER